MGHRSALSRAFARALAASTVAAAALCALGCASEPAPAVCAPAAVAWSREAATRDVAHVLDDLHDAAAHADEGRYFSHFAPDAVFLGTDATERWDLAAFRAYAHPHFAAGKGWTYRPTRRAISFDADGDMAWFDEDLLGERAGPTRGSGVLVRRGSEWLVAQYDLTVTVPNDRFAAVRAAIDAPPPAPPLRDRYKAAYQAAIDAAGKGDLAGAGQLLAALVPEAKTRPDDDLEFWLHNELTWVRWAAGDLAAARSEVEQAKAMLDHATLAADASNALRLHERWDRAYLALEAALAAPAGERAKAMAEADRARADYESIARPSGDHDGMAVLATFFAVRRGDARGAATEARRVDVTKDDDLQDLYVLSLAFDAAGDHAAAASVRARICGGNEYLMKPLIVRQLAKEGHACGAAH